MSGPVPCVVGPSPAIRVSRPEGSGGAPSAGRPETGTNSLALLLTVGAALFMAQPASEEAVAQVPPTGVAVRTRSVPEFSRERYQKFAVGEFTAREGVPSTAPSRAADFFVDNLLDRGYRVVNRRFLEYVLEEQGLQYSEITSDSGRARLDRRLEVDAILTGRIPRYREREDGEMQQVELYAQLTDVKTGEVVWSGWAEYRGEEPAGAEGGGAGEPDAAETGREDAGGQPEEENVEDMMARIMGEGEAGGGNGTLRSLVEALCTELPSRAAGQDPPPLRSFLRR